jgi:uncharacterized membrane protein required for colicin V production
VTREAPTEVLAGFTLFDVIALLTVFGFFVLGFAQGAIRRLLGLAVTVLAVVVALLLRDAAGDWLARYWQQYPAEYVMMLAFGGIFLLTWVAASITVQSFYKRQDLFARSALADELVGGLLGVLQAIILIGMLVLVLDSFYTLPGIVPDEDEIGAIRSLFEFVDPSRTAALFRDVLLPAFVSIAAPIVPADLRALYT